MMITIFSLMLSDVAYCPDTFWKFHLTHFLSLSLTSQSRRNVILKHSQIASDHARLFDSSLTIISTDDALAAPVTQNFTRGWVTSSRKGTRYAGQSNSLFCIGTHGTPR